LQAMGLRQKVRATDSPRKAGGYNLDRTQGHCISDTMRIQRPHIYAIGRTSQGCSQLPTLPRHKAWWRPKPLPVQRLWHSATIAHVAPRDVLPAAGGTRWDSPRSKARGRRVTTSWWQSSRSPPTAKAPVEGDPDRLVKLIADAKHKEVSAGPPDRFMTCPSCCPSSSWRRMGDLTANEPRSQRAHHPTCPRPFRSASTA